MSIAAISLFRGLNSLFGRKNSLFQSGQGICCNTMELLRELTTVSPKTGRKRPEFEKYAVVFPVRREIACDDRGRSRLG
jgi:hypothetical protein